MLVSMCGGADQLQRWEILGNIWHVPTKTLLEKSFQTISDTKFISIMAKFEGCRIGVGLQVGEGG